MAGGAAEAAGVVGAAARGAHTPVDRGRSLGGEDDAGGWRRRMMSVGDDLAVDAHSAGALRCVWIRSADIPAAVSGSPL